MRWNVASCSDCSYEGGCREMVQRRYCKANGYDADCTVIYGDTDSVMVDFHEPDCAKAMELGRAAAAEVSATFTKPSKLEFEKVSWNGAQTLPVTESRRALFMLMQACICAYLVLGAQE